MKLKGTPLAEWGVNINYGIKTGLNKAFIIDRETRDRLIAEDPRSEDILKPILRGRDIRRFKATCSDLYLIATVPACEIDIADYPSVMNHLLSFGRERLEQAGRSLAGGGRSRKKTRHDWFELQDTIAYYREFERPKLFWTDLTDDGRFTYDTSGVYGEATTFIMTGRSLRYLCAVLNSKLATWFLQHSAPTSGMGTFRWKKAYVETIPVPDISTLSQQPLVELADIILATRKTDPSADTREEEAEIDRMVYDLYDLTAEESRAVEAWLTARP